MALRAAVVELEARVEVQAVSDATEVRVVRTAEGERVVEVTVVGVTVAETAVAIRAATLEVAEKAETAAAMRAVAKRAEEWTVGGWQAGGATVVVLREGVRVGVEGKGAERKAAAARAAEEKAPALPSACTTIHRSQTAGRVLLKPLLPAARAAAQ